LADNAVGGNPTVFEETAADFTAKVDKLVNAGRYRRGNLFLSAAAAAIPPKGDVLDYGCGPGRISALLARHGYNVLGVDPSPGMISAAKQQVLDRVRARFEFCDSWSIDNQIGAFDAIVCSSVIEYEAQPADLMCKFHRALRPSGALIVSFANSRSLSRALFQRRNLHLGAQVHTWNGRQFIELLVQCGFKPIRQTVYFESFFDRFFSLGALSASPFIGALGLIVAARK
jgi:2-polyprenyl-3-methyl-5-hydroxy-6-metoxy-1,4-benzoquinol methylase